MALVINTNIASINAQRNLFKTQLSLNKALARLSSGLRINSAKDDAAGLAISDRMTAQIRGLTQAVRNANDGISLSQTAEGALQEMTNMVLRMRELAVQSRNVTNTDSDRFSLDAEFQQLKEELERIATTTSFNGKMLLDGTMGQAEFQVGANASEVIVLDLTPNMKTSAIGRFASSNAISLQGSTDVDDYELVDEDVKINGVSIGAVSETTAKNLATAINAVADQTGVTATYKNASHTFSAATITAFGVNDSDEGGELKYSLEINGETIFTKNDGTLTAQELADAINSKSDATKVTARVDSDGNVILTSVDGADIDIAETVEGVETDDTVTGLIGVDETTTEKYAHVKGTLTLTSEHDITLEFANDGAELFNLSGETSVTYAGRYLNAMDILTTDNADIAINGLDKALKQIDDLRSTLGAIQSRFESTIANLQSTVENVSAARSRIMDADFAQETAEMTRAQILQQSGIAMLAQTNQLPQMVLSLLQ